LVALAEKEKRAGLLFSDLTPLSCPSRMLSSIPQTGRFPEAIKFALSYAIRVDAGFFFGLCRALRRPVGTDGMAFVSALFGTFDAPGSVKREAHLCSKRL
jgi:hypothetical protein